MLNRIGFNSAANRVGFRGTEICKNRAEAEKAAAWHFTSDRPVAITRYQADNAPLDSWLVIFNDKYEKDLDLATRKWSVPENGLSPLEIVTGVDLKTKNFEARDAAREMN